MKQRLLLWLAALGLGSLCMGQDTSESIVYELFKTPGGKEVKIGLIKHGSLSFCFDGFEVQVDPVTRLGKVTDYSRLPKADLILVTHAHADHLDARAIEALWKEGTRLVCNAASRDSLSKGEVLHNGQSLAFDNGLGVEAVPAYNTSPGHLKFHPKGEGNGYVLSFDGLRIYVAGDTEDIPELAALQDIDIAFLPVNQPYTMTLDQAERAARSFMPKVLYPYHFGDTPVQELPARLQDTHMEVRVRELQ